MDNKLFKAKLLELAEIKECKPSRNAGERLNDQETIAVIDGEHVVISQSFNPSLGFELVKVKQPARLCELGCGEVTVGQVIEKRLCQQPRPHWRTRCNCGKYLHPNGEDFIKGGTLAAATFICYLNESNK